ncbi:putative choline transporter, neither null mutation nor overexpression affects choline transport [Boothiomyces sp. JEL0838]|nr:putative choline transporter, neither null mutation nor overexpression affects choline transport [Boothiomyces sp. JEL0838]
MSYQQQPYGQSPYGQPQQYQQNGYGGQQQYYQQPQPQVYQQTAPPNYQNQNNLQPKKEDRFKSTQYKDGWAIALWFICLLGFTGVSAYSINYLRTSTSSSSGSTSSNTNSGTSGTTTQVDIPTGEIIGVLVTSAVAGFLLSTFYFFLMQRFAGTLIKVTLIIAIIVNFAIAALFFIVGQFVGGIVMLVVACLVAWAYWSWRFRIPFAKVILKTVTSITKQFPGTLVAGVTGLIVQVIFIGWWVVTAVGIAKLSNDKVISGGATYGLFIFTIFFFYWNSQVIGNAVHITVAGVFATFYFQGIPNAGGGVTLSVQNPTSASAKRALTTGFGPNCYGSLLIAIIQTLKFIVNSARKNDGGDNIVLQIILCCIACILSIFQDLLEYFNKYAFAQVAIYGKDYCTAAKDTWELAKSRGIDAVINDNLIGNVLGMGCLFIGLITAAIAVLYVKLSPVIPNETGAFFIMGVAGLFIGVVEFSVLSGVIDSGVTTTFVCLAEDPQALLNTKPNLFNKIREVYPQVLLGF